MAKKQDAAKVQYKPGLEGGIYKPFNDEDAKRIAEAAFRILEQSGMVVYSPTAFEAMKRAGAKVDESTRVVRMPRAMVEDAVDSNPSSITLHSRNGDYDAVLTKNKVHYGTGGTALYVLDPETGEHRPSRTSDVILNAKLAELLENVHVFTINVFPNEIQEKDHIDVNRFFHSLDNTRKHVMGGIYSMEGCRKVVEMAEMIAGGAEALQKEPFISFITLIISPFKIDKDYAEMTCFVAEKGLPVVVPTEPMCGTTAPITLAGNVLVHTAETIGGICMVQCVKKGARGICGSVGSISDLRTMGNLAGAVERGMINAAVAQMAQYFGIPMYATAGTSDAKEVDIQAAYESALSNLLVAMSGANYIHDSSGLMDFDLTVSYEKLVMDDEILGMCQRVLKGIEVSDETMATELIINKGPGKDFLAEEHTVKHMRGEFFFPRIANRQKRNYYTSSESAMEKAKEFIKQVMDDEQWESRIEAGAREKIIKAFPEIKVDGD